MTRFKYFRINYCFALSSILKLLVLTAPVPWLEECNRDLTLQNTIHKLMCKNPTEGSSISFQDINQASLKDEKRSSVLADLLCMLTFFNCVSQEEAVVGEGGEEFLMQGRQ